MTFGRRSSCSGGIRTTVLEPYEKIANIAMGNDSRLAKLEAKIRVAEEESRAPKYLMMNTRKYRRLMKKTNNLRKKYSERRLQIRLETRRAAMVLVESKAPMSL